MFIGYDTFTLLLAAKRGFWTNHLGNVRFCGVINRLQIEVANSWANRLMRDEHGWAV
jgi:hypothetical protein